MRSVIFFFVLLGLAASAQERPSAASQPKFRVGGTVVNSVTGEALSEVEVAIGNTEQADAAQSMVTSEDGRFHFDGLSPTKYWLAARGRGFSPQRFDQHDNYSTAIAVGPSLNSENLVFRLRPDATITGTVTDEQSEPVRNAQVMLFREGAQNPVSFAPMATQTMTDDRGVYRFSHQEPGTYYVAVLALPWYAEAAPRMNRAMFRFRSGESADDTASPEAAGSQFDVTYPVTYYSGSTDPGGATPIVLKPGDVATADLSLTPVPALHLRLTGLDLSQGISASLSQRAMGGYELPLTTQMRRNNHEIEIVSIPAGQFDLTLQSWGKNPSIRQEHIVVTDDSQTDASDTSSAPTVSGIVRMDTGEALSSRAFFHFLNRASGQSFGAQVSAKGEFEVANQNIRPGTYDVSVFGVENGVIRKISATGAKIMGEQIEVAPGASVRLVVTLSRGVGRVDGTALRDGKPLAGAMVVLVPKDIEHNAGMARRDQSDSDGTFSLANVLPGEYTVIAIQNGWEMQWTRADVLQRYLSAGETINVGAHGKYNVKINVQ